MNIFCRRPALAFLPGAALEILKFGGQPQMGIILPDQILTEQIRLGSCGIHITGINIRTGGGWFFGFGFHHLIILLELIRAAPRNPCQRGRSLQTDASRRPSGYYHRPTAMLNSFTAFSIASRVSPVRF